MLILKRLFKRVGVALGLLTPKPKIEAPKPTADDLAFAESQLVLEHANQETSLCEPSRRQKMSAAIRKIIRTPEHQFFKDCTAQGQSPLSVLVQGVLTGAPQDNVLLFLTLKLAEEPAEKEAARALLETHLLHNPQAVSVLIEKLHLDIGADQRQHVAAALAPFATQIAEESRLAVRANAALKAAGGDDVLRLAICTQAAAFHPDQPNLMLQEAYCLADMNRTQDGDVVMDQICERFPGSASALAVVRRFSRRGRMAQALALLQEHMPQAQGADVAAYTDITIELLVETGDLEGADRFIEARAAAPEEQDKLWSIAKLHAARCEWDKAQAHLERCKNARAPRALSPAAQTLQAGIICSQQTGDMLRAVPLEQPIKGVCVMITLGSRQSLIWKGLSMAEMRKRGYASIVLEEGLLEALPTGDPEIDRFHGCLLSSQLGRRDVDHPAGQHRYDWVVDIENEIVEANGLNIFQPIRERISTVQRRYSVNFEDARAQEVIKEMIQKADVALGVYEDIVESLGSKGLAVRFLGSMNHYVPSAVYKKRAAVHEGSEDIGYVGYLLAYQHYYTIMGNTHSSAISVKNMTKAKVRMPHKPTREEFLGWVDRQEDTQGHLERARELTMADRGRVMDTPERQAALDRIEAHKVRGGKVVCLFGKLTYDIGADKEGGPGHKDMADWLRHSVEAVRGHEDVLLLIKPHPNEMRRELNQPTEFFFDLLPDDLPANVMALDHRWFNNKDLIPLIDLGTIWHGTAILELMSMKVPIMACSWTGMYDNPIVPLAPESRAHYAACLRAPGASSVSDEAALHAALTIVYMGTDEQMIPYTYAHLPFLRGVKGDKPAHWFPEQLQAYLEAGDPNIAALADRIM